MELAALRLQVPAAIDAARADALSDALVDANAATGRCSDAATDRESDAATLPIVLSGQPGLFCRGMDLAALLPGDGAEAVNPDAATLRGGVWSAVAHHPWVAAAGDRAGGRGGAGWRRRNRGRV